MAASCLWTRTHQVRAGIGNAAATGSAAESAVGVEREEGCAEYEWDHRAAALQRRLGPPRTWSGKEFEASQRALQRCLQRQRALFPARFLHDAQHEAQGGDTPAVPRDVQEAAKEVAGCDAAAVAILHHVAQQRQRKVFVVPFGFSVVLERLPSPLVGSASAAAVSEEPETVSMPHGSVAPHSPNSPLPQFRVSKVKDGDTATIANLSASRDWGTGAEGPSGATAAPGTEQPALVRASVDRVGKFEALLHDDSCEWSGGCGGEEDFMLVSDAVAREYAEGGKRSSSRGNDRDRLLVAETAGDHHLTLNWSSASDRDGDEDELLDQGSDVVAASDSACCLEGRDETRPVSQRRPRIVEFALDTSAAVHPTAHEEAATQQSPVQGAPFTAAGTVAANSPLAAPRPQQQPQPAARRGISAHVESDVIGDFGDARDNGEKIAERMGSPENGGGAMLPAPSRPRGVAFPPFAITSKVAGAADAGNAMRETEDVVIRFVSSKTIFFRLTFDSDDDEDDESDASGDDASDGGDGGGTGSKKDYFFPPETPPPTPVERAPETPPEAEFGGPDRSERRESPEASPLFVSPITLCHPQSSYKSSDDDDDDDSSSSIRDRGGDVALLNGHSAATSVQREVQREVTLMHPQRYSQQQEREEEGRRAPPKRTKRVIGSETPTRAHLLIKSYTLEDERRRRKALRRQAAKGSFQQHRQPPRASPPLGGRGIRPEQASRLIGDSAPTAVGGSGAFRRALARQLHELSAARCAAKGTHSPSTPAGSPAGEVDWSRVGKIAFARSTERERVLHERAAHDAARRARRESAIAQRIVAMARAAGGGAFPTNVESSNGTATAFPIATDRDLLNAVGPFFPALLPRPSTREAQVAASMRGGASPAQQLANRRRAPRPISERSNLAPTFTRDSAQNAAASCPRSVSMPLLRRPKADGSMEAFVALSTRSSMLSRRPQRTSRTPEPLGDPAAAAAAAVARERNAQRVAAQRDADAALHAVRWLSLRQ